MPTLDKLTPHISAIISGFSHPDADLVLRLREIGFAEGDKVEIVHKGLFGGSPLAVRLDGITSIAIRPQEAAAILVTPEGEG